MRILLAIESSTDIASVALSCPAPVPASSSAGAGTAATAHADQHATLLPQRLLQRQVDGVQSHSLTVLPMVQALLAEAGITLAQCDTIAFGAGPGSFTGVRTACGIAQGLAFGADLPVVPVDTMMAMAQACREGANGVQQPDILVILDARMNEVYWAQYRYTDGWQAVLAPTLSAPSTVTPLGNVLACGNGLTAYSSAFDSMSLSTAIICVDVPHAAQVAQLAASAFARGDAVAAGAAQPFYLRNKIALTTAERSVAKAAGVAA